MPIIQNIPAYRLQILNNLSSLNNNIPLISNLVLSSSGSPTKIYKTENNFSLHKKIDWWPEIIIITFKNPRRKGGMFGQHTADIDSGHGGRI